MNSKSTGIAQHRGDVAIKVESAGGAAEIAGSHLLVAVGRTPNTDDLGLDSAGILTDRHGYIEVDDELRTSVGETKGFMKVVVDQPGELPVPRSYSLSGAPDG